MSAETLKTLDKIKYGFVKNAVINAPQLLNNDCLLLKIIFT